LENTQRTKKGATFNVSLVGIYAYDSQPVDEPDYSQMYMTLLGFLGQQKYQQDLKTVINSSHFDQKMELIIRVLNDLLPNEDMEELLLALNREGENILDHVLKAREANPRLVNLLITGKPTKENLNKLIVHTIDNITADFTRISTLSIRLASYQQESKTHASPSDFENIKMLIQKYEEAKEGPQGLYQQLLTALLTVPNLFNYDISKLIDLLWSKPERHRFYSLLAAVLPYYPKHLQNCSNNDAVQTVLQETKTLLLENQ
jgi:hypothetical protein